MRKKLLFVALALAIGCGACSRPTVKGFSLDGWGVVYNDREALTRLCGAWARGCADYNTKTIYCDEFDFRTCGHELHHISHGSWHDGNGRRWTR
jgi:hypothetical protein